MYYKSVNRGLTFTKAGIYCIAYVMFIGLLAIVSGVNALYLFLSTGMALLIISGLLSERVMKMARVVHLGSRTVNAETPFHLPFSVQNIGSKFTTYGLETYFFLDMIKMPFIAKPVVAPLEGTAIKISPGETRTFDAQCKGMPRGHYQHLVCLQKTGYPFGFLEKFKFKKLECDLIVTPKIDEVLLEQLSKELLSFKRQNEDQMEFFAHRGFTTQDSLRHIDWRRSAAKPSKDWVVKIFRNNIELQQFSVKLPLGLLQNASSEEIYETLLCRVQTATQAIKQAGYRVSLAIDETTSIGELKEILKLLARFPSYVARDEIPKVLDAAYTQTVRQSLPVLDINSSGYRISLPKRGGKSA